MISKARSRVSELRNSAAPLRILPDVTGSRKFKMAAAKPEVLIFRLPDDVETRFQRLDPVVEAQEVIGAITDIFLCNRKSEIEDGGRETGNTRNLV